MNKTILAFIVAFILVVCVCICSYSVGHRNGFLEMGDHCGVLMEQIDDAL